MIKIIQGDITTLAVDAIVNAVQIAVREVRKFLSHAEARRRGEEEMEVVLCCFSERDKSVYENLTRAAEALDVSRNAVRKYL